MGLFKKSDEQLLQEYNEVSRDIIIIGRSSSAFAGAFMISGLGMRLNKLTKKIEKRGLQVPRQRRY